jgi:hypothetical protein
MRRLFLFSWQDAITFSIPTQSLMSVVFVAGEMTHVNEHTNLGIKTLNGVSYMSSSAVFCKVYSYV